MEEDDRPEHVKKEFPLRKMRLDLCICYHDDSDHQTEVDIKGIQNGACSLCVCKRFIPLITKRDAVKD